MKVACRDLLDRDPLAVRGILPVEGPFFGDDASSLTGAPRCLPDSLWRRLMLEMWCRVFLDGKAAAESSAAIATSGREELAAGRENLQPKPGRGRRKLRATGCAADKSEIA
jgi:hypothetical protein